MTKIIGLLGAAGAGKSTIAQHIAEKYGATRYRLAGLLKTIARRTLDLAEEQVDGTQAQKEAVDARYGFSPRWFLQRLGTEGVRATLGQDFWTDALLAQIRREAPAVAVIEDVRFVNEARILRAAGATVWRIELPDGATSASTDAGKHASETEWREAEYDVAIRPAAFGVEHLLRCADDAMAQRPRKQAATWTATLEPFDLAKFADEKSCWSRETFGPADRYQGVVAHIRKELDEVLETHGRDLEEWVDVILLAMDGAWRSAGADGFMLVRALLAKHAKNQSRTWPDWRTLPEGAVSEHIRVGDETVLSERERQVVAKAMVDYKSKPRVPRAADDAPDPMKNDPDPVQYPWRPGDADKEHAL